MKATERILVNEQFPDSVHRPRIDSSLLLQFQTELRKILVSLIEVAQKLLALNPDAVELFKKANGNVDGTVRTFETITCHITEQTVVNRCDPDPSALSVSLYPVAMLDEDEEDRVDETALHQLTEMGFPESRAIKALRLNQWVPTAFEHNSTHHNSGTKPSKIRLSFSSQHVSDPGDGMADRACGRPLCRHAYTWSGLLSRGRRCRCRFRHAGPLGPRLSLGVQPSPQPFHAVQHRGQQQAGRAHRNFQEDPEEKGIQTRLQGG